MRQERSKKKPRQLRERERERLKRSTRYEGEGALVEKGALFSVGKGL
jgi:hypothetical protein